jgi:hypothetical protein
MIDILRSRYVLQARRQIVLAEMKSARSAAFRNYRQTTRDMGAAQVGADYRVVTARKDPY